VQLRLVQELEDWGQKAQVIFDFADTKLLRVVSTPPSPITYGSSPNAGTPFSGGSKGKSPVVGGSSSPQLLSSDEAQLATECLLLYIKALAFLLHGINRAKAFWEAKVAVAPPAGEPVTSSPELNEAVQWLRQRFNECHDKADYVKGRIGEGQQVAAVSADKLIYDRALEMVRFVPGVRCEIDGVLAVEGGSGQRAHGRDDGRLRGGVRHGALHALCDPGRVFGRRRADQGR
jgi:serine/threonine-protein kinase ULK/ATG1